MKIKLQKYFKPIDQIFLEHKKNTLDFNDPKKRRIFIDNGANILLVAHLDTVHKPVIQKVKKDRIIGAGFDDRAGYMMIDLLLQAGITADVLLTDLEESARSTAEHHTCKDYHWIMGLDRAGADFVDYGLACDEMRTACKKFWSLGYGSFSDICSLETEAARINVGIGYQHAHSQTSVLHLDAFTTQYQRIIKFYEKHKDTRWTTELDIDLNRRWTLGHHDRGYSGYGFNYRNNADYWEDTYCPDCGEHITSPDGICDCLADYAADDTYRPETHSTEPMECDICRITSNRVKYSPENDCFLCPICNETYSKLI